MINKTVLVLAICASAVGQGGSRNTAAYVDVAGKETRSSHPDVLKVSFSAGASLSGGNGNEARWRLEKPVFDGLARDGFVRVVLVNDSKRVLLFPVEVDGKRTVKQCMNTPVTQVTVSIKGAGAKSGPEVTLYGCKQALDSLSVVKADEQVAIRIPVSTPISRVEVLETVNVYRFEAPEVLSADTTRLFSSDVLAAAPQSAPQ